MIAARQTFTMAFVCIVNKFSSGYKLTNENALDNPATHLFNEKHCQRNRASNFLFRFGNPTGGRISGNSNYGAVNSPLGDSFSCSMNPECSSLSANRFGCVHRNIGTEIKQSVTYVVYMRSYHKAKRTIV